MKRLCLSFIAAVCISSTANAQDWNCNDPANLPQQGMNYCAFLDFKEADKELNATWKATFPRLKKYDRETDHPYKGWSDKVLSAQRAWITYRDDHCTSEGFKFRGGSMEPLIYNSCRANLTRARTKQLINLLEDG